MRSIGLISCELGQLLLAPIIWKAHRANQEALLICSAAVELVPSEVVVGAKV